MPGASTGINRHLRTFSDINRHPIQTQLIPRASITTGSKGIIIFLMRPQQNCNENDMHHRISGHSALGIREASDAYLFPK